MSFALWLRMETKPNLPSLSVTIMLASIAGCSGEASSQSGQETAEEDTKIDLKGTHATPAPMERRAVEREAKAPFVAHGTATTCPNPVLGSVGLLDFVSLTGTVANRCAAGIDTSHCNIAFGFLAASDVALDYGNFPFSRITPAAYFYAVVAQGFEHDGFFQGATGNLSDNVPSAVPGDLGSGDTLLDRTIVINKDQIVQLFPSSHGTHAVSFPPSQFETIQLAPFDTTPEGKYVLVICPITAKNRCDCAFDAFMLRAAAPDGGSTGTGGAGGAPGNGSDASAPDARASGGSAGSAHDAGAMCPDM